jgi:ParB family chromosome partitioning protein
MARKTGLGRGLDALIAPSKPAPQSGVGEIPVSRIQPNPRQPRTHFDEADTAELAASIREHGVIQPLIVTVGAEPGEYVLIAGERRWLAARLAGLGTVPAIVREVSDQSRLEIALIENLQRTDLGPLEAAEAYRQLVEDFGLSHKEIADHVGKDRVTVSNTLRLLKLPPAVKTALVGGQISEGHARALLGLATPQAQSAALKTILDKGLNVRQTEELVRRLSGEKITRAPAPAPPAEVVELENQLRSSLGTRVNLNRRQKGGGTLVIHFYSDEELDAIVDQILRE